MSICGAVCACAYPADGTMLIRGAICACAYPADGMMPIRGVVWRFDFVETYF